MRPAYGPGVPSRSTCPAKPAALSPETYLITPNINLAVTGAEKVTLAILALFPHPRITGVACNLRTIKGWIIHRCPIQRLGAESYSYNGRYTTSVPTPYHPHITSKYKLTSDLYRSGGTDQISDSAITHPAFHTASRTRHLLPHTLV